MDWRYEVSATSRSSSCCSASFQKWRSLRGLVLLAADDGSMRGSGGSSGSGRGGQGAAAAIGCAQICGFMGGGDWKGEMGKGAGQPRCPHKPRAGDRFILVRFLGQPNAQDKPSSLQVVAHACRSDAAAQQAAKLPSLSHHTNSENQVPPSPQVVAHALVVAARLGRQRLRGQVLQQVAIPAIQQEECTRLICEKL